MVHLLLILLLVYQQLQVGHSKKNCNKQNIIFDFKHISSQLIIHNLTLHQKIEVFMSSSEKDIHLCRIKAIKMVDIVKPLSTSTFVNISSFFKNLHDKKNDLIWILYILTLIFDIYFFTRYLFLIFNKIPHFLCI